jgi:hypothetical protein
LRIISADIARCTKTSTPREKHTMKKTELKIKSLGIGVSIGKSIDFQTSSSPKKFIEFPVKKFFDPKLYLCNILYSIVLWVSTGIVLSFFANIIIFSKLEVGNIASFILRANTHLMRYDICPIIYFVAISILFILPETTGIRLIKRSQTFQFSIAMAILVSVAVLCFDRMW